MTPIGPIALLAAFAAAIFAGVGSVVGARRGMPDLVQSGRRAALAVTFLILLACAALLYALYTQDFSYAYVAEHTARSTPWFYRLSSFYSGQQGSLLYWSATLSIFSAIV